jgi:hypothetical protein
MTTNLQRIRSEVLDGKFVAANGTIVSADQVGWGDFEGDLNSQVMVTKGSGRKKIRTGDEGIVVGSSRPFGEVLVLMYRTNRIVSIRTDDAVITRLGNYRARDAMGVQ